MAKKKQTKAKDPVKIRFKELANGNQSIYLDCYIDGKRSYEFLGLYLIPETDFDSREQNKQALIHAKAIQSKRNLEIIGGKSGIAKDSTQSKMSVSEWLVLCREYRAQHGQSLKRSTTIECVRKHIVSFTGTKTRLMDVDKDFCLGFLEYLKTQKMTDGTQMTYWSAFASSIGKAYRDGILQSNPTARIEREDLPKIEESKREFLTREEVDLLREKPCTNDMVKRAFLFSCFTGLRYSDVSAMTWENIAERDGKKYLSLTMQKTRKKIDFPLSCLAIEQLPEHSGKDEDKVFILPHYTNVEVNVRHWAEYSGITKKVTFHVARHTFATLTLSAGADIYTVSKLVGHSNVTTTQIYAKVLDKSKADAIDAMDALFKK